MTPVMMIIVMSNITIAMLTNIITRQQNFQTLKKIKHPKIKHPNAIKPPTLAAVKL